MTNILLFIGASAIAAVVIHVIWKAVKMLREDWGGE